MRNNGWNFTLRHIPGKRSFENCFTIGMFYDRMIVFLEENGKKIQQMRRIRETEKVGDK